MSEKLIVGVILILVGLGVAIVGYNKTQPTTVEKAVSVIEEFSGLKAPASLKPSKSEGIVFIVGGCISFAFGLKLILNNRKKLVDI